MLLLGEPSRQAILRALAPGSRCVTDLASEIGLSQSCTTRHLQALERERIVRRTRSGKRVLYELRTDETLVADLLQLALGESGSGSRVADRNPAPSGDGKPAAEAEGTGPAVRPDIEDYLL